MAGKKRTKGRLAPRGDLAGLAAIRLWTMQLETAMTKRYIGNAPVIKDIQEIASDALRRINAIEPLLESDCAWWDHQPDCQCEPPPI